MEMSSQTALASSSPTSGVAGFRARVHRTWGTGLTKEVESALKSAPMKRFTLKEMLTSVRGDATKYEVAAILAKFVKRELVQQGRQWNGWRFVNDYKWRLPGDGCKADA